MIWLIRIGIAFAYIGFACALIAFCTRASEGDWGWAVVNLVLVGINAYFVGLDTYYLWLDKVRREWVRRWEVRDWTNS